MNKNTLKIAAIAALVIAIEAKTGIIGKTLAKVGL